MHANHGIGHLVLGVATIAEPGQAAFSTIAESADLYFVLIGTGRRRNQIVGMDQQLSWTPFAKAGTIDCTDWWRCRFVVGSHGHSTVVDAQCLCLETGRIRKQSGESTE